MALKKGFNLMRRKKIAVLITLTATLNLFADLTLPTIFTDHMVLQRDQPVPVWGTAPPGSTITVMFADQQKTIATDSDGKWRTELAPMSANAKPQTLTILSSADQTIKIRDVLIGDVWLCSGQSNMAYKMRDEENGAAAIAAASNPLIRLYKTPPAFSKTPAPKINSAWTRCTPETLPDFSAVGYYFGKKMQKELHVPIGLLLSAWGGTRIEPWTPPGGFKGFDSLAAIRKTINDFPARFGADRKKRKQERQHPCVIYNAMIHAHIPFAIKGVIWYQGEANRKDGMLYVDKTAALLKGWRSLWGCDFPFYFVQIAPYQYGNDDAYILPAFWEAQASIVKKIPKTGMAVISDTATLDNIHPPDKRAPGIRLALLALDNTYGRHIVSTGPTFKKLGKPLLGGSTLKIIFSSSKGLTTRDGNPPDCFEIAGADGTFKPAQAEIKGNAVFVSSDEISKPVAVRFAWNKVATPNLINSAGLPCPAFRARLIDP